MVYLVQILARLLVLSLALAVFQGCGKQNVPIQSADSTLSATDLWRQGLRKAEARSYEEALADIRLANEKEPVLRNEIAIAHLCFLSKRYDEAVNRYGQLIASGRLDKQQKQKLQDEIGRIEAADGDVTGRSVAGQWLRSTVAVAEAEDAIAKGDYTTAYKNYDKAYQYNQDFTLLFESALAASRAEQWDFAQKKYSEYLAVGGDEVPRDMQYRVVAEKDRIVALLKGEKVVTDKSLADEIFAERSGQEEADGLPPSMLAEVAELADSAGTESAEGETASSKPDDSQNQVSETGADASGQGGALGKDTDDSTLSRAERQKREKEAQKVAKEAERLARAEAHRAELAEKKAARERKREEAAAARAASVEQRRLEREAAAAKVKEAKERRLALKREQEEKRTAAKEARRLQAEGKKAALKARQEAKKARLAEAKARREEERKRQAEERQLAKEAQARDREIARQEAEAARQEAEAQRQEEQAQKKAEQKKLEEEKRLAAEEEREKAKAAKEEAKEARKKAALERAQLKEERRLAMLAQKEAEKTRLEEERLRKEEEIRLKDLERKRATEERKAAEEQLKLERAEEKRLAAEAKQAAQEEKRAEAERKKAEEKLAKQERELEATLKAQEADEAREARADAEHEKALEKEAMVNESGQHPDDGKESADSKLGRLKTPPATISGAPEETSFEDLLFYANSKSATVRYRAVKELIPILNEQSRLALENRVLNDRNIHVRFLAISGLVLRSSTASLPVLEHALITAATSEERATVKKAIADIRFQKK
ncbi:MAG: hypothetical protein JXR76_15145 [Deltaproteobacteria bacterium]|nr:hypothetical protein [Deltaproteobacteria bacterium]